MDNEKEYQTKEFIIEDNPPKEELEIIVFDEKKEEAKQNIFKKLLAKWKSFNKKIKLLIIIAVILIIAGTGILVFALTKKDDEKPNNEPKTEENIVIKDNYKYKDGSLIILGNSDEEIGTYECRNKDVELCFVSDELNDDNFDVPNMAFEDGSEIKTLSKIYHNRFVFIYDNIEEQNGVIQLYDLQEKTVIDSYLGVKSYNTTNKDLIVLKDNSSKFGLVELSATGLKTILKFDYQYMGIIPKEKNESAVVKQNNKWSIVDFKGKVLLKSIDQEIKGYTDKYVVINGKDGYSLINYSKEVILSDKFVYLELLNNLVIGVLNNNSVRIYDYNGNKMNEEGIKLTNTNYNRTYIYKNDGTFKEIKSSYEYELSGDSITITVQNTDSQPTSILLNLLEGKISAKLKYHSYFDGKLFFYKDDKKQVLIGSYTCENKNFVNEESSGLDKCFVSMDANEDNNDMVIALNTTSISPIINNRFVFIRDAAALALDSVVKIRLYDFGQNQVISQYVSINSYGTPENANLYHATSNNLYVVAKNKGGKYGLVKISPTSVDKTIEFEYDTLEKMGSFYLGKKGNTWTLLNERGQKQSSDFSAPIRGYKGEYVKVLNSGRYEVRKMDGSLIAGDYKYVELYDDYYAGVSSDNKLTIYRIDNGQSSINTPVQLDITSYYGVVKPAFACAFSNNSVSIVVTKKNETTDVITYNLTTGNLIV